MVLAWSVFEEMPSPPFFPPPTSKANMFCCGGFFFSILLSTNCQAPQGVFPCLLSLQKLIYLNDMLGAHCCYKLWCLSSSRLRYSFLENCGRWGYPRGSRSPLKLSFSCIFPKRFPFPIFWEERRWVGPIFFHVIERQGSCLNTHLPPGETARSPGWVSPQLLPPVGPLHQHPPFAQPKVVTESFITHLFPCHRPASPWHLLQPVMFMVLLSITVM